VRLTIDYVVLFINYWIGDVGFLIIRTKIRHG